MDRNFYSARGIVPPELLYDLFVDNQYIAFSVLKDTAGFTTVYHNFKKKDNAWYPLSTNDLFNLNSDNAFKINDLLTQKIKQLTDKDIDCGTSDSFWQRAQNQYLVRHEGVVFYFTTKQKAGVSTLNFNSFNFEKTFVPILLTWAELKPFLKK